MQLLNFLFAFPVFVYLSLPDTDVIVIYDIKSHHAQQKLVRIYIANLVIKGDRV